MRTELKSVSAVLAVLVFTAVAGAQLPTVSSGTLHTHLSADVGVHVEIGGSAASDGQTVGYWMDQSGNGHHAAQYEDVFRPVLKTNVVNGKPVLRFDGVNDYIQAFFYTIPLDQPNTIFIVLETRDSGNRYIYDGIDNTNRQVMAVGRTAQPGEWFFWAGVNLHTTRVYQGFFQSHAMVLSGGNLEHYVIGEYQGGGSAGVRKLNNGMHIGSARDGSLAGNIDVAEVIVYAGALNATDRQAVETYLETKYDLQWPDGPLNLVDGELIARYDGTDVVLDAGGVATWNDQVGTMHLLGQVDPLTEDVLPLLVSENFPTGAKNVVRFNIQTVSLQSNPLAVEIDKPSTFFVVARRNADDRHTYILDGLDATSRRAFLADGSPRTLAMYSQYFHRSYTPDVGLWQLFTVIFNGTWSQIYVDGFVSEPVYGYPGNVAMKGLTVGSHFNGSNRLDGDIAEILIYKGAMNDAARLAVQQSLFDKYGIGPVCGGAYTEYNVMDFDLSCEVDFLDFVLFAKEWLKCTHPGDLSCD